MRQPTFSKSFFSPLKQGQLLLFLLLFPCLSLGVANGNAARQPAFYNYLQRLPTNQLIAKAAHYVEATDNADSALACYTIATSRYNSHMKEQDLRLMGQAFTGKWYVYLFNFYDYPKAYESLITLEEIAARLPDIRSRVYNNFGIFYQTLAEQGGDRRQDSLALSYYRKAFWLTSAADGNTLDLVFTNLVSVAERVGKMGSLRREWLRYKRLPQTRGNHYRLYNYRLYEANLLMAQRRYADAERVFASQLRGLPQEESELRYHYSACADVARAQAAQGHYADAIATLTKALAIARQQNMKDAELEAYRLMMDAYAALGDSSRAEQSRYRYLCLKDTLLNYQQLTGVNELRFLNQMRKFDEQIQANEHKRQTQQMLMLIAIGVALVVGVLLIVLWRKNRRLRQSNANLYDKTVAMLRDEEEARRRREELERQLAESNKAAAKEKYQTSHLAEDNKTGLMERIREVMETSDEIYTSGFSCDRLAQMVGSNYKYVSQVINETRHCNFSAFLNEYRIKEACKRISDTGAYGNLTIEAISNSVGFKSRSSFVAAFKRFTGLTPSEYHRQAVRVKKTHPYPTEGGERKPMPCVGRPS
jgi:AraC-like DNA-binding protein